MDPTIRIKRGTYIILFVPKLPGPILFYSRVSIRHQCLEQVYNHNIQLTSRICHKNHRWCAVLCSQSNWHISLTYNILKILFFKILFEKCDKLYGYLQWLSYCLKRVCKFCVFQTWENEGERVLVYMYVRQIGGLVGFYLAGQQWPEVVPIYSFVVLPIHYTSEKVPTYI